MAATLDYHYSGGGANTDPADSLGGSISSEKVTAAALNNLFYDVEPPWIDGIESVQYVGINIKNRGDAAAENVVFYFVDTTNADSTLAVWEDTTGTQSIADQDTAPIGATFATPVAGSKLSLSDIASGASRRLWIRRSVVADADNINNDLGTMHTWYS